MLKAWVQTTKDGKGVELRVLVRKDGRAIASFTQFIVQYDPNLEKDVQMVCKDRILVDYYYDCDAHEIVVEVRVPEVWVPFSSSKMETLRFPYLLP